MKYLNELLTPENVASDEDIDLLFDQLEVIEPPSSLVESILASVRRLSSGVAAPLWFGDIDSLIVRRDVCEPS